MLKTTDFSNRRGGVVPLLPKIHAMFKENALADKSGTLKTPGHFVIWQQQMNVRLRDINWRFIIALDDTKLAGLLFYRHETGSVYIEELQFEKNYAGDIAVFDALFFKVEMDKKAIDANFFASVNVKLERNKEMLASVGFKECAPDGYESIGNLNETKNSLKIRFFAGSGGIV